MKRLHLFLAVLLAAACNHELSPPPGFGSGAGGFSAGGGAGGDGLGGQGGNTSCFTGDACVQSCFADFSGTWGAGYCDATGTFTCPPGTVRLSTCPPNACVQFTPACCDDTTGADTAAPCGPDGLKQACPAGTHAHGNDGCIPASLGVAHCYDLNYAACGLDRQSCIEGAVVCVCGPSASDGGALAWQCAVLI